MQNVLHDVYLSTQPMTDVGSNLENALKKTTEQVKKYTSKRERENTEM